MKNNHLIHILTVALIPISLNLAQCAGPELKIETISLTEDPTEQLASTKAALQDAKSREVDKLSPSWYQQAKKSYMTASEMQARGGPLKVIFENLALSRAQLDRAEKLAPMAEIVLVPVIEERDKALRAGADRKTAGFDEAEKKYLKLATLVENDRRDKAEKMSPKVKSLYRQVELTAIQDRALNPARRRVKEALKYGAANLAPSTLAQVEMQIEAAANFIAKDRYNTTGIEMQSERARLLADRAVVMTEEARKIDDDPPEKTALRFESMTAKIAGSLELPDVRGLGFAQQTNEIVQAIAGSRGLASQVQSQAADLEAARKTQESQQEKQESLLSRLQKDKEFEETLKSVRDEFAPNEAEVYQQGNRLVIRLKGANFPSGDATIPSSNFPLLAKVTESIKRLDSTKITVEGHTDSTGLAETNDKLSAMRAESVRQYLVANGVGTLENVESKGFGYRRPIASNKTPDGRKENRRIDLIVELKAE